MTVLKEIFTGQMGLKESHYQTFIQTAQLKTIEKKDHFIKAGSVCNYIGFINSGLMRSYVQGKAAEHNTDFYFENYFVSAYSSVVTRLPTEHSIQALTDVEIYCLSLEQLNTLIQEDTNWLRFSKYVGEFFLIRKCKREISFLKLSANERMEDMLSNYPGIEQLVSQYHIASYLGIKPESLSRIKLLEASGGNRIDEKIA
ncbi:Crp/Fnr family transcriptional regulator [Mucilaginibacter litoreus]|uniref:Crp/Fnr family transcriptional regulator n=1 Tax=Mucilaginibacter litoreus TaxID=1048221 RepID=A0ABW3AWK9_9SPHI